MTSSSSWMLIHSRPPDKDERLFFTLAQKARQQISACRSLRQFITGFQVCAGSLFQNKGDLDKYTGSMVCSKQLYKEALNHTFDEPKQWEIREINEIMNQCITGWRYFPNPRMFSEYGRQKGWERENPATDSGNPSEKTMDGFVEVTEQMELPF